jgi:SAM-dependent methyltransferase
VGLYERHVLPWILDVSMRQDVLDPYRRRLAARAQGRVLEIGMGSALNLPYYGAATTDLVGLEPLPPLLAKARAAAVRSSRPVVLIEGSAEAIPLDAHSVDTVLTTWTLCSIPDVAGALSEARRVLRPGGQLLFVEHGRSTDASVGRWQDRLTPLWKRLAGGCHLNRPIGDLVSKAGFRIEQIETGYMTGPRPLTFMYEGRATPR